ncbi:MAG: diaminopimelate epimerase [Candidatus Delongbacteria bacterium]|jgi:diaminopimelate epimerase|nr:diaminopimelate epimerase [Candidatus Delongbacteria bacterium]
MKFYKMHGAGNDFIFFEGESNISKLEIVRLCDRNLGVGADGIIFISKTGEYDFKMEFFNPDGSNVDFCANGGRCAVLLASKLNFFLGRKATFEAGDGIHEAEIFGNNLIKLKMTPPKDFQKDLKFSDIDNEFYFINTGVEHVVGYFQDINSIDVNKLGKAIRYDQKFPNGTNVNFVQKLSDNQLSIRTYERGVEAETKACGTGITAAGIIDMELSGNKETRAIKTILDYELKVEDIDNSIYLTGPADLVFEGEINVSTG